MVKVIFIEVKMIYNLLLYMGLFFIIAGFSLFLYSEVRLREIDRQLFRQQQLTKSFDRAKLVKKKI